MTATTAVTPGMALVGETAIKGKIMERPSLSSTSFKAWLTGD